MPAFCSQIVVESLGPYVMFYNTGRIETLLMKEQCGFPRIASKVYCSGECLSVLTDAQSKPRIVCTIINSTVIAIDST